MMGKPAIPIGCGRREERVGSREDLVARPSAGLESRVAPHLHVGIQRHEGGGRSAKMYSRSCHQGNHKDHWSPHRDDGKPAAATGRPSLATLFATTQRMEMPDSRMGQSSGLLFGVCSGQEGGLDTIYMQNMMPGRVVRGGVVASISPWWGILSHRVPGGGVVGGSWLHGVDLCLRKSVTQAETKKSATGARTHRCRCHNGTRVSRVYSGRSHAVGVGSVRHSGLHSIGGRRRHCVGRLRGCVYRGHEKNSSTGRKRTHMRQGLAQRKSP